MRKIIVVVFLGLATLAVMPGVLSAQELKTQKFMVMECVVKPSMEAKFREAMKEDVAFSAKTGFAYPWSAYAGDDGRYYLLHPVKDLADVDNLNKSYAETAAKDPEGYKALSAKFVGTYDSYKISVYTFRPDLSFLSENPYYPAAEMGFTFLDIWYMEPEKEAEAEGYLKEFVALSKSKGVRDTWYCLAGGIGADLPVNVFCGPDKSQAEFIKHNAEMWKLMGDAADAPYNKSLALCRKREARRLWYDPELSYTPITK